MRLLVQILGIDVFYIRTDWPPPDPVETEVTSHPVGFITAET